MGIKRTEKKQKAHGSMYRLPRFVARIIRAAIRQSFALGLATPQIRTDCCLK